MLSISNSAHADLPAAIVLVGDVPADGAVDAARQEMSAAWRLTRLVPVAPANTNAKDDESLSVARAYFDADFLRCLTKLQSSSLDVDRLLERDRRSDAARVGTLAAACALGAGDKPRARELVHRLLVRGLESAETLRQTTPEFQALVDDERAVVRKLSSVTIEIQTSPDRASVHVDGLLRCRNSPCRVHAIRGEHIVTAELLGRRPRSVTVELDEDQRLTLALDDAPAEDVRGQLLAALATGTPRTDIEVSQASANAFGARVVILVWAEQNSVHATAYDRSTDRISAHVAIDAGPDAVPAAIRAAVHEERGVSGPKPILRQPFFWLTVAGVALLTGTIVLLANRPVEVQHGIIFH
jgi:IS1 family transposase